MAQVKTVLGKVGFTPKGAWAAEKTYDRLDVVTHEGSSFLSLVAGNTAETTDATKWQQIAARGDKGVKGDTGDKGEQGEKGDAFTYDDFTAEQIEALKKPATDAAAELQTLEDSVKEAETARTNAETARASAEETRASNEEARASSETSRTEAEALRKAAEETRVSNEEIRKSNETSRTEAEAARVTAEEARVSAEASRVTAEAAREEASATAVQNAETATANALTATAAAEKVNATIEGSVVKVTDREGVVTEYELEQWDENVTVIVHSDVSSVSVSGMDVDVYYNNAETYTRYTTDAEGKITFTVPRGSYYKVVFHDMAGCNPIAAQGYTAVLHDRTIEVTYEEYTEDDKLETVTVFVRKYSDSTTYTVWEGVPVKVTIGTAETQTFVSDAEGKVTFQVPWGTQYTVATDEYDGYYVKKDRYTYTYTADIPFRYIHYNYHAFRTGVFVVHSDGTKYTADEWTAAGYTQTDAVGISVVTAELVQYGGVFTLDINALHDWTYVQKQWCKTNVQFYDIVLNGNATNDPNYYDGKTQTQLIIAEAAERDLEVPLFDYVPTQMLTVGGETLTGYVGSLGQHFMMWYNIDLIDEALTAVFGDSVDIKTKCSNNWRWTSTQSGASGAFRFNSGSVSDGKDRSFLAVPFYAC